MQITSNKINDHVFCPSSKSYANRALIVASLMKEDIHIDNISDARDVSDLLNILEKVGIQFVQNLNSITVHGSFPHCENKSEEIISLPGSEGGTTIRFLIPLLALGKNTYKIPLKAQLSRRPMDELVNLVNELGGKCSQEGDAIIVKGAIGVQAKIQVNCAQTSQFASALKLLTCAYPLQIELQNLEASHKYLEMTDFVIKKIVKNKKIYIPADMSSLAYLMVYGAVKEEVLVKNVFEIDTLQADSMIFKIFDDLEIQYIFSSEGLLIKPKEKMVGFTLNCNECLDLAPTLIVLACFCETPSTFKNLKNLRFKESDRLAEMLRILDFFGASYLYNEAEDNLKINPDLLTYTATKKLELPNDHRMVMVATLLMKFLNGGVISSKESVRKSFANFFEIFEGKNRP